jgi:HAD superfamily hydrolase (TIGR01484 family)
MSVGGMVVTDMDGTLLDGSSRLGERARETLAFCKEEGILRAVATGRNLYSARKVMDLRFPVDYLIFSSGAGIIRWEDQQLIHSVSLEGKEVEEIYSVLRAIGHDFMVHHAVPENHRFFYSRAEERKFEENDDFFRRVGHYAEFASPLDTLGPPNETRLPPSASQFLAVCPPKGDGRYDMDYEKLVETIQEHLPKYTVIRTTSPMDHASLWIEIFPGKVSKGHGAEWLRNLRGIEKHATLGIGNDYNDLHLLEWAATAYVVKNAPASLKDQYSVVASNEEDGFADAVSRWLVGMKKDG